MKRLGDTHHVDAVAREAAVLRHPIAADADIDARLLGEAWREWTTATLLTQLNGYVYDQKITVLAGGRALTGPHEAFNAPKDEWRVDDAGRDLLVSLFLSDQAVVLPTFNVQPCPSAVPPRSASSSQAGAGATAMDLAKDVRVGRLGRRRC